jgi:hypothetical protein
MGDALRAEMTPKYWGVAAVGAAVAEDSVAAITEPTRAEKARVLHFIVVVVDVKSL